MVVVFSNLSDSVILGCSKLLFFLCLCYSHLFSSITPYPSGLEENQHLEWWKSRHKSGETKPGVPSALPFGLPLGLWYLLGVPRTSNHTPVVGF